MSNDISKNLRKRVEEEKTLAKEKVLLDQSKKNKEEIEKIEWLKKIINHIKDEIVNVSEGKSPLETNKEGLIFTTNTKKIFSSSRYVIYNKFIHSQSVKISFFEKYNESDYPNILSDFKKFLSDCNIEDVYIVHQHDGVGVESWNDYYIKLEE